MKSMPIPAGSRFGRWAVIADRGSQAVNVLCDCGTAAITRRADLRGGRSASCGCGLRDLARTLNVRRADATYLAVHLRLRTDRGPASDQPCVDCGRTAEEWSLDRALVEKLGIETRYGPSQNGRVMEYAADPLAYVSRCRSCHRRHDGHARGTCRAGHDLTLANAIYIPPGGGEQCRACRNAAKRAYAERRRG